MDSTALSRQCLKPLAAQMSNFKFLSKIAFKKPQSDEVREIGRDIRLHIPSRQLKNGEFFSVPVRIKHQINIAEFTLRCEIQSNTYIEFVRVIWPWEADESLSSSRDTMDSRIFQLNNGFSAWDISQRYIPSLKGNVTEIVARYRETAVDPHFNEHSRDDQVIYKLLFHVVSPPKDSIGRIGPRFIWSLVSLSRRNAADQSASSGPIVTRLNVESLEFKHLALIIKSKSLINTAVLSGYPVSHPVWVFGLTHRHDLIDVTTRSTCHTGDEAVAHFPQDVCPTGLTFSGGELGGSDGLSLVAKVDGTSAGEIVTIWLPQQPHGVSLSVSSTTATFTGLNSSHEHSTSSVYLHALADSDQRAQRLSGASPIAPPLKFQQTRLRVFARFTTANPRMPSSKDYSHSSANEASTSPTLDVTHLVAHCLRLEFANESIAEPNINNRITIPISLVVASKQNNLKDIRGGQTKTRVWLVGRRPGRARVRLAPGVDSPLVKAAMPTALTRMRKQENHQHKIKQIGNSAIRDGWQYQTIWVTVTDNDWVWPVGITVQLVTDLTVTVSRQNRSKGSLSLHPQTQKLEKAESNIIFYTAQIRFSGSRVGRSEGFLAGPDSDTTTNAFTFQREGQLKRSRRQLLNKTLPRQGLLFVTLQFSDGSSIPWHHIMEVVWELGESAAPFTLTVQNLRPDLVRIDMPTLPPPPTSTSSSRQKRSVDSQWFTLHEYASAVKTNNESEKEKLRPDWLGPKIFLLREDESFIGDLLRVNLLSSTDNSLLYSAPVYASIVAARPSRRRGEGGAGEGGNEDNRKYPASSDRWEVHKTSLTPAAVEESHLLSSRAHPNKEDYSGTHEGGANGNDAKDSLTGDQLDNNAEAQWKRGRGWNHLTQSFETFQKPLAYNPKVAELFGSPALKDAPGVRSVAPNQQPSHGNFINESSAKLTNVLVDRPNADSGLNEIVTKQVGGIEDMKEGGDGTGDGKRGRRPTLELIAYILLGLFILIALIFAVNCAALVVRYRCEHSQGVNENMRLHHLSELAMSEANTDAAGIGEFSSNSTADLPTQEDYLVTMHGIPAESRTTSPNECFRAFAFLRRKFVLRGSSQQPLDRDNNWIWLGPNALAERQYGNTKNRLAELRLAMAVNSAGLSRPPAMTPVSTFSGYTACHYKGDECSIRILTNTVEPDKLEASTSPRGVHCALTSSQHLHQSNTGLQPRNDDHYKGAHRQVQRNCYQPHLDHRRRSAFIFGQSLILDNQNPVCQSFLQSGFSHQDLQNEKCHCSRAFSSSWRYLEIPQSGNLEEDDSRRPGMTPMLSVEGYQTLPNHVPIWQDGSDYGTPPCPPVRTSSKLNPPLLSPLLGTYGSEQSSLSIIPRPISYPSAVTQKAPLLTTSVTNAVYSLLSCADDSNDTTLTRQKSATVIAAVRATNRDLPHRIQTQNITDFDGQSTSSTPGSYRIASQGPLKTQSAFKRNYVDGRPTAGTPIDNRSTSSESFS